MAQWRSAGDTQPCTGPHLTPDRTLRHVNKVPPAVMRVGFAQACQYRSHPQNKHRHLACVQKMSIRPQAILTTASTPGTRK